MAKPTPLSQDEIEGIVGVLRKWIDESGIEHLIKKKIKDYAFILIGSSAFGYAAKGKSDVDLLLI